ncbi:MAG TPA: Arc family DNA-binding protein [Dehalococcoidia bacterium]|nr:Arc family DNA-binding protein [Dehalococcoidia bacterium]
MPNILIRDVDPKVLEKLKKRASSSGRSLQAEVRRILEESSALLSADEFLAKIKKFQAETAGRQTSDSADLIREDRER